MALRVSILVLVYFSNTQSLIKNIVEMVLQQIVLKKYHLRFVSYQIQNLWNLLIME